MLAVRKDRPVPLAITEVIKEVNNCTALLGVQTLLVGATARLILLENVFGQNPTRATNDIDFAIAVESWGQFDEVRNQLISTGKFRSVDNVLHRLYMTSSVLSSELKVDLIPFGNIENADSTIRWPHDISIVMNLAGYKEALDTSLEIEIEPALTIRVVSLAGLAILKMFAWADRGDSTDHRDAIDFYTILRAYGTVNSNDRVDRMYSVETENALQFFGYDIDLTGAWLLGKDVHETLSKEKTEQLIRTVEDKKQQLIIRMAQFTAGDDDAFAKASNFLEAFLKGILF